VGNLDEGNKRVAPLSITHVGEKKEDILPLGDLKRGSLRWGWTRIPRKISFGKEEGGGKASGKKNSAVLFLKNLKGVGENVKTSLSQNKMVG